MERCLLKKAYIASLALATLLVGGCSTGAPSDTSEAPADTSSSSDGKQAAAGAASGTAAVVEEYFNAHASNDPTQLEDATALTVPGSVAEKFAMHRSLMSAASRDNGYPIEADSAEFREGTVETCSSDDICTTFDQLEFEGDKIASFRVNETAIDDRVMIGPGEATTFEDIAGFEVLSSYQATSNDILQVVIKFEAHGRAIDAGYIVNYRTPDGRQVQSTDAATPSQLNPDSHQLGYAMFPAAEPGGELLLKFATEDDGPLVVETLTVPTA